MLTASTAMALLICNSMAAVTIQHTNELTIGNTDGTTNLATSLAATSGDIIFVLAAKNKSSAFTYDIAGSAVATANLVSTGSTIDLISYTITTTGTFNLDVNTVGATFSTVGLYQLRAGSGEILAIQDSGVDFRATNVAGPHTLDLNTGSLAGVTLAAYASGSTTAFPAGLTGTINSGTNRAVATGTYAAGPANITYDWTIDDATKNSRVGGFTVAATPVPEPSSTALLGLGALALVLRRRK